MKCSIIIPAYNVADYIRQAIDSCINQNDVSDLDYEIIVIDDGATDTTGSIIDEYSGVSNVRIIHQQNRGLSGTRNKGVEIAHGEFILYLDGDDWLRPDALSTLFRYMSTHDLIVFPMTYCYPDGTQKCMSYCLNEGQKYSSHDFLSSVLGQQKLNIIPAPCKCYRRSVLIASKQTFIEGILHEDNPYFADTCKNYDNIVYVEKGIYMYRQQRAGSITNSQTIRNFQGMVAGEKHIIGNWGFTNKYINYMNSSSKVFQVILPYKNEDEVGEVMRFYRQPSQKLIQIKQLLNFPFIPNALIRHILLLMDPLLLRWVIKMCS